jgi:hypothetical protein
MTYILTLVSIAWRWRNFYLISGLLCVELKYFVFLLNLLESFATIFLGYLRGTWRNLMFHLISVINFYYVINKLIILLSDSH